MSLGVKGIGLLADDIDLAGSGVVIGGALAMVITYAIGRLVGGVV